MRHQWNGTTRGVRPGHYDAWACGQIPGVTVRHCGHLTALRPYYVEGLQQLHGQTFPRLVGAIEAAEEAAGVEPIQCEPVPAPPRRRVAVDVRQAAFSF